MHVLAWKGRSLLRRRAITHKNGYLRVFPGGPAVKNPPFHAKDIDLIPDWGAKTPRAMELLNPCTATRDLGWGGNY